MYKKVLDTAPSPDITEHKQGEEALQESRDPLRVIFNAIQAGVLVINADTHEIVDVNPSAIEFIGSTREKILGSICHKFVCPADKGKCPITDLGQTVDNSERVLINASGQNIPIVKTVKTMIANGQKCLVESFLDITELKQVEQELQEKNKQLDAQNEELRATEAELRLAKEKLEERVKERMAELEAANDELREAQEQLIRSEKLAAIGELAGGVGHELRNPLGAIKNAVYYVRGKVAKSELGQQEPRVLEFLNIIDNEINSSNKIISDLLGFSRVGKPSVSPVYIDRVIEDALSRVSIPESVKLVKKLKADLPEVEVDTDQIRQVLVNIIMNALQAMPEGGRLTIATGSRDNFLKVKVIDTGYGIPEDKIGKIFDSLFTTKAKGIGLGLAVCKAIIERHQGKVKVKSIVGEGTTFTIELPVKTK